MRDAGSGVTTQLWNCWCVLQKVMHPTTIPYNTMISLLILQSRRKGHISPEVNLVRYIIRRNISLEEGSPWGRSLLPRPQRKSHLISQSITRRLVRALGRVCRNRGCSSHESRAAKEIKGTRFLGDFHPITSPEEWFRVRPSSPAEKLSPLTPLERELTYRDVSLLPGYDPQSANLVVEIDVGARTGINYHRARDPPPLFYSISSVRRFRHMGPMACII
jgi:hypothetical protein